jgi:dienelactone hydrolase
MYSFDEGRLAALAGTCYRQLGKLTAAERTLHEALAALDPSCTRRRSEALLELGLVQLEKVNYAGSTGYGRSYRERLTGQWGVLDVADCLDAARSLIRAGEVDGQRLVISGESAGGFTALCAVASEDLLAAGVSWFGIADLETFRQQAPKFQAHELDRLVGPYPEALATYRARSPLHAIDRIARPVLLVHGLGDTVVPPIQAQAMAEALDRRGVRHVFLTFPGEGHGFRRPESIRRALEVELSFYVAALGLRRGMPDMALATDDAIAAGSPDQRLGR